MTFFDKIKQFNEMYRMPTEIPLAGSAKRIDDFVDILKEELNEADAVAGDFEDLATTDCQNPDKDKLLIAQADLADLLGDIIVYCASEAGRWGIPIEQVLNIIMESNFSKLGADGKPIYDDRGKLMKGPNYWKPEEKIRELLRSKQ